jgi:pimeloyl-ACP methyl ester carboxylesterase
LTGSRDDGGMFATSGSARLAYEVAGAGDSVVLVHAGVNDRRGWLHLTERLAPRHRVVAYDQRGYGETECTAERWSQVTDVIAVLDDCGIDRAAIVGCSMGGGIAIDLALEHPDRVSRLALIAPAIAGAPWFDTYPEPIQGLVDRTDAAEERGEIDEANRLNAWLWLDGPTAPEGRVGGPARDLFLDMNRTALASENTGDQIRHDAVWNRLDEIAVPTLMLSGELDLPDQLPVCAGATERIPDSRLIELAGVAHLPHLEADEACLAAIVDFLD